MNETLLSRTLRRLFAGGGVAGLALLALPMQALAQETAPRPAPAPAPEQAQPVQRVQVTGSLIRRSQAETSQEVLTVNRNDIEKSGKATVAELLQSLAVDNQGSVPSSFGNGFAPGASGISLRGMGVASTLVLVNGRRVAPYGLSDDGQKQFTDLNIIPADAVDRIEILLEGASSTYGSDAIAGVVNVILRNSFTGHTVRASDGITDYWDGEQTTAAYTMGFGDLDENKWNALLSLEYKKLDNIQCSDRTDRDWTCRLDLRRWNFSAQQALGGTGAITGPNAAGSAINGNVRNPATLDYFNRGNLSPATGFTRFFPGANCANFTDHPQDDPGGGCLIDAPLRYSQVLPVQESISVYGRGTWQFHPKHQAFTELIYYTNATDTSTTPSTVSASEGSPAGAVSNAGVALGANHPDNPYFGSPARLRYLAGDVGSRRTNIDSNFIRFMAGLKGSLYGWDYDSAIVYSHNNVWQHLNGYLQRDVAFALLNPTAANVAAAMGNPAYAALPPGTFWRIAENAGLNSPALYQALSPTIHSRASTELALVDFKATRDFAGILPWGALGAAVGGEFRHEMSELNPVTGTERGNIIGLGFSGYKGSHNVSALYAEGLAPLPYKVELSAAMRWDRYTDVGSSWTPKAGIKWTPLRELAVRGTYARGFRAPGPAENGVGGLAAFATADDPVRCALGVEAACNPAPVALITRGNPNLAPEHSSSWDIGAIWDPLPRTSVSVDLWRIKRRDEINQVQVTDAIASGSVLRDPSTADPTVPGDPGAISVVEGTFINSSQSVVKGIDLDARYGFPLPQGYGNVSIDGKLTHLYRWERTERDGTRRDFAGTHGNCDVTNCAGTPRNRANVHLNWERDKWRVTMTINYRSHFKNVLFQGDPAGCASTFADGVTGAPSDCEIASFTTFDLTARWKPAPKWEVFGSIQNLFDKLPPLDPLTYGAQSYNPLDFEGARGRMLTLGARYTF
ncbi:TonB-dependent receptor [Massilia agilis]|uniref:TonB-dependent receptor n=1 Tax=Massilia agilis TaxID=1811226 RepID=A0ABT2DCF4_9BURK|nr:TonB-dependent receptor [Massilia agilis]MCS0808957.1 TonB-dependent receptor [Massilia agilis]